MQVGEPISIPPPAAVPTDAELGAALVSITFKSGVKTSRTNVTIEGPHWEEGRDAEIEDHWTERARVMRLPLEPYSKRVAVYLTGASAEVQVQVRVTRSRNVGGEARLVGTFQGLAIEGSCPTRVGEHTVLATIRDPPREIRGYRGKIAWRLLVESPAISVDLDSTLAELYFILDRPSLPYKRFGVWAEALRFLCGRVGVAGESDARVVAAKVAAYCHGRHILRYETRKGLARYGVNSAGGTFGLSAYLARVRPRCNCYDQAGAVQALSGAVGVTLTWLYLKPFGYIRPTSLVGVGMCNNPFFRADRSKRLVDPRSNERRGFGNHAFVGTLRSKVLDACARPHLGTETVAEYLKDSIDDTPSLYGGAFRPGAPDDVCVKVGVREVI